MSNFFVSSHFKIQKNSKENVKTQMKDNVLKMRKFELCRHVLHFEHEVENTRHKQVHIFLRFIRNEKKFSGFIEMVKTIFIGKYMLNIIRKWIWI